MSKQKIVNRIFQVIEENKKLVPQYPCSDSVFYADVRTLPDPVADPSSQQTVVQVVPQDTFDCALDTAGKCLVLNMASERVPGGGCRHGSRTQEEMLMYRSNYLPSLQRQSHKYPLYPYNAIYTPDVVILRDNEKNNFNVLKRQERKRVACIALPALRRPRTVQGGKAYARSCDAEIMKEKIRGIFKIAALHGHKTLILGALGCGAFDNPPDEVAEMFRKATAQYDKCFDLIKFAVLDGKRWNNYPVFKSIL